MNARAKKILLWLAVAALLFGSGRMEKFLDHDRYELGLTISQPLRDAPPVLALTTQALGGFRGLISNFLWMRANEEQLNDQYFEAAQLANWITDLEPHYSQVWAYESWNMAWNISVKFKNFADRWRWVNNGIQLLRDRGLVYNPNDTILYQQLAWIFQNKMGEYLDDANFYYKTEWAKQMTPFFGPEGTNFDDLIHPRTPAEEHTVSVLTNVYKINPVFAKQVNEEWGPLDWRSPEANAIYWAALGLEQAKKHPDKVKESDLIQLRRVIYQSMMQEFQHGQIIDNPFTTNIELAPDLAIIPKVNDAYETEMRLDTNEASNIAVSHRNFLRDAVYYLYEDNRIPEAQKWFDYLAKEYPDKTIIDGQPDSYPRNVTLDQYCVSRVQEDVTDTSSDTMTEAVAGMLIHAYANLALGQQDRYVGFARLARKAYDTYNRKIDKYAPDTKRVPLPPFRIINDNVLSYLLDPQHGWPYAARSIIRSQLGLPGDANLPYLPHSAKSPVLVSPSTNAPEANTASTNSPTQ